MESKILGYSKSVATIEPCDGSVQLNPALNIPVGARRRLLRVLSASVSSNIPNVFTYRDFTNARVNISRDNGVTWYVAVLPTGVYSVSQLSAAINSAAAEEGWWTTPSDPGFTIGVNAVTDYLYLRMDSSKLAVAGQLRIDFSVSSINLLTGFTSPAAFSVDGLYGANTSAQMDWFGNRVQVLVQGFGPVSYKDGTESFEICSIPLSSSAVLNEYLFPLEGTVSPYIQASIPDNVRSYSVSFIGSRRNADGSARQLMLFDGDATLYLELAFA